MRLSKPKSGTGQHVPRKGRPHQLDIWVYIIYDYMIRVCVWTKPEVIRRKQSLAARYRCIFLDLYPIGQMCWHHGSDQLPPRYINFKRFLRTLSNIFCCTGWTDSLWFSMGHKGCRSRRQILCASLHINSFSHPTLGWLNVFSSFPPPRPCLPPPLQWLLLLTPKLFELNLRYLGQREYRSGKMYWMTSWWP